MIHVLIVDDEKNICSTLTDILEDEGYEAVSVGDGKEALAMLERMQIDIMLLDIWLPGMGGMDVLRAVRSSYPSVIVILISGHGTVNLAVEAIKAGAFDFIEKPLSLDRVLLVIEKAIKMRDLEEENRSLRNNMNKSYTMIGSSPAFQKIRDIIGNTAKSSGRVLIYGENGTGKEVIARNIHMQSDRRNGPFVEVNCAAIPENLIESELFGHEKGAFTGAVDRKLGKFELANNGTLFLDEIADMTLQTQAKVLRVLQEMEMERVGGVDTIHVDVRVIAATNKDLQDEIHQGNFREDLYYRLNVIPIYAPPLRERREDLEPLVNHFVEEFCKLNNKRLKVFTKRAMSLFYKHDWPGNVRELRNMVERIIIMVPAQRIDMDDILPFFAEKGNRNQEQFQIGEYQSLKQAREDFEREYIRQKLIENGMNISKTAKNLQIERSNLHRKINNLNIDVMKDS